MRVLDEQTGKGMPCVRLSAEEMRAVTGRTTSEIVRLLAGSDGMHASEIARRLGQPEQNVHYHVRKLRDAGVLHVERMHDTAGGTAKELRLAAPAFCITHGTMKTLIVKPTAAALEPFVRDGRWNGCIVASSPDPHGPESARGRDTELAVDIAMFFGSFLETPPEGPMVLDTQLRDWDRNLVIIGGPVVNKAAERLNSRSPAPYDRETKTFRSALTGKTYGQENVGVIVTMDNPYADGRKVLLVAGKRYAGTRAAILACIRHHEEVLSKELTVVLGVDRDSDGQVDDVEVLE